MEEIISRITAKVSLPLGVETGSLIDFETTGIPWREKDAEVITLGYFYSDQVTIIQRLSRSKAPFYEEITKIIEQLPRPFYAYNAEFEQQIIRFELGIEADDSDFVDIMLPWRSKAEYERIPWPKLDDLIGEPEDYFFSSGEKVRGSDIPRLWRAYLVSGSGVTLRKIMEHCVSDVLREIVLYGRYLFLTRNTV